MPPYIHWSEPWTKAWAQETVWWDINVDQNPESENFIMDTVLYSQ